MTETETDEYVSKRLGVPALHERGGPTRGQPQGHGPRWPIRTTRRSANILDRIEALERRDTRFAKHLGKQGNRIGRPGGACAGTHGPPASDIEGAARPARRRRGRSPVLASTTCRTGLAGERRWRNAKGRPGAAVAVRPGRLAGPARARPAGPCRRMAVDDRPARTDDRRGPVVDRYSNSTWVPGPVMDRIIDHLRWVSGRLQWLPPLRRREAGRRAGGGDEMTGTTANTDPIEYINVNLRQVTEVVEELAKHLHIQQENLADTRHRPGRSWRRAWRRWPSDIWADRGSGGRPSSGWRRRHDR